MWKFNEPRKGRTILKKNKVGGHTLQDFKIFNEDTEIKKQKCINGTEQNSEIDPHIRGQLTFDKGKR